MSLKPSVEYLVINFARIGRSRRCCRPWHMRASRTKSFPTGHMTFYRTAPCTLTLLGGLLATTACNDRPPRPATDSATVVQAPRTASIDTASPAPVSPTSEAPATETPVSASDGDRTVATALDAYLNRHLYGSWAPTAEERGGARSCNPDDKQDEGMEANDSWGIARARVLPLDPNEREHGARMNSPKAEVVRILTIQGDPSSSDGMEFGANQLVIGPRVDTLSFSLRQRRDSTWYVCEFPRLRGTGILLLGPGDTLDQNVKRRIPANATWALARTLADSVARSRR